MRKARSNASRRCAASFSIRRSPSTRAASSRPPATACWWNLRASSMLFVSNTVHDHVRDRLSFVFEDLGEQQVKNVRRPVRFYRVRTTLTHPVPTDQVRGLKAHDAPGSPLSRIAGEGAERRGREAGEGNTLSLPDKPSIAVLPFANMSGDPEQEYFVDGMVEEIITALSRIRWLFVIARNSSFTYKGQSVDVKQVGRELGVRYVLEGSVRKAGQRVRI